MIEEICCCTVIFVIVIIILSRLFWRPLMIYPSPQQPPQPPSYQPIPDQNAPNVINMVKCQHCGMMYDETLPGCPGCGS